MLLLAVHINPTRVCESAPPLVAGQKFNHTFITSLCLMRATKCLHSISYLFGKVWDKNWQTYIKNFSVTRTPFVKCAHMNTQIFFCKFNESCLFSLRYYFGYLELQRVIFAYHFVNYQAQSRCVYTLKTNIEIMNSLVPSIRLRPRL